MIRYKKETIEQSIPESVTCDVCKKEYSYSKENILEAQEFQYIRIHGGYDSVFGDDNKLKADICQHCFKKIMGEYLSEDNDSVI